MKPLPEVDIRLLPLDIGMDRTRLASDSFALTRTVDARVLSLHFGPEFPGEALPPYPGFLTRAESTGIVDGSFIVVDPHSQEVLGQLGTLAAPDSQRVEIGHGINLSATGRGDATEAVAALVAKLHAENPVRSIIARTSVTNPLAPGRGSADLAPSGLQLGIKPTLRRSRRTATRLSTTNKNGVYRARWPPLDGTDKAERGTPSGHLSLKPTAKPPKHAETRH